MIQHILKCERVTICKYEFKNMTCEIKRNVKCNVANNDECEMR